MTHHKSLQLAAIAIAVTSVASAPAALAATATGTLLVSAVVLSTCIVAATPIVFGNYSFNTPTAADTTGLITVTCTPDITTYNVGLGIGAGSAATIAIRKLTSALTPASTLDYALFRDTGRTQNWGQTVGTDTALDSTATTDNGTLKIFTVYARLGANQVAAIGAYADTVAITVTY